MKKTRSKQIIIVTTTIIFSLICGIISKDIIIGVPLLITGILCSYYASIGKKINFIFGFVNLALIAFVSFKNNLYGTATIYTLICLPMQITGYFSWNKKQKENILEQRILNSKKSILLIISCLLSSFILGFLLSLIPNQQLSFLDASSNIINICGIILLNSRYKEAWWIFIVNNIIDETIWIIVTINKGENSIMMLLVSTVYLLINVYGIIKWNKQAKSQLQE